MVRPAVLSVLLFGTIAIAAITPAEQQARIQKLEDALLAPCCYTEPVSRHQSEVSAKMRIEIAKSVAAGRSDQEILDRYVEQYGRKVLVDPSTAPGWWTSWIPWLTLLAGAGLVVWLLKRWSSYPPARQPAETGSRKLPDIPDDWIV